jgi:hypothetical protein
MSVHSKIPSYSISDLEKIINELTRLEKENFSLLIEMAEMKQRLKEAQALVQIESKVYSGIRKCFK